LEKKRDKQKIVNPLKIEVNSFFFNLKNDVTTTTTTTTTNLHKYKHKKYKKHVHIGARGPW